MVPLHRSHSFAAKQTSYMHFQFAQLGGDLEH